MVDEIWLSKIDIVAIAFVLRADSFSLDGPEQLASNKKILCTSQAQRQSRQNGFSHFIDGRIPNSTCILVYKHIYIYIYILGCRDPEHSRFDLWAIGFWTTKSKYKHSFAWKSGLQSVVMIPAASWWWWWIEGQKLWILPDLCENGYGEEEGNGG